MGFIVVQLLSCVQLFATPWTAAHQALCPSLSPGVCSYSCLLSLWHYLTISSSAASFSFSLNLSQHHGLFQWVNSTSSGQSIGALASISVPPMNIQCWFPLGLIGLISLQSKEISRVFSSTTIWKHQPFGAQTSLWSNSHIHTWLLEKP